MRLPLASFFLSLLMTVGCGGGMVQTEKTEAPAPTGGESNGETAAPESPASGASPAPVSVDPKKQTIDRMRAIAKANQQFHDARKSFPPGDFPRSADGQLLLSWRVYLLPYLNQKDLYRKFHLDEPWNSPHNMQVAAQVPEVYIDPTRPVSDPMKTTFVVPQGEKTGYTGDGAALSMTDLRDGPSNTILLLNVMPDDAVTWSKPEEWVYDPENPLRGLDNQNPEGKFDAVTYDGRPHNFSAKLMDAETMRRLLERDDGKYINWGFF